MHSYAPIDLNPDTISATADVIIVNYNGKEHLRESVPRWLEQSADGYVNTVYIVDNDSDDGSVRYVRESFPEVEVIENNENFGWGHAVSQGVENADSELVFITTPDMIVTQSWCHRLIESTIEDESIGAATGIVLRPSGEIDGRGSTRNRLFRFHPEEPSDDITTVDSGRGSALLVRQEAFHEAGGIDEDLFIQWEEVNLTYKLREKGYRTVFVPGALVWHCEPLNPKRGLEYYTSRNLYLLAARHLGERDFVRVVLGNAVVHFCGHPVAAALGRRPFSAVARTYRGAAEGITRALWERIHGAGPNQS